MSNADDRCAGTCVDGLKCNYIRRAHGRELGQIAHAFVEPAPQPAPSALDAREVLAEPQDTEGLARLLMTQPKLDSVDHLLDEQPSPSGDEAKVRELARAEAESIATRWVPAHMTARQGMVDDITASLVRYRALGVDAGKADGAREEREALTDFINRTLDYYRLNKHAREWLPFLAEEIARRGSEGT